MPQIFQLSKASLVISKLDLIPYYTPMFGGGLRFCGSKRGFQVDKLLVWIE